jgi:hypothetical protein
MPITIVDDGEIQSCLRSICARICPNNIEFLEEWMPQALLSVVFCRANHRLAPSLCEENLQSSVWCPRQDLNLQKSSDSLGNADGNAQIDAQILVVLGHDLSQVVTAWAKLPAPLKAAILAIINSAEGQP